MVLDAEELGRPGMSPALEPPEGAGRAATWILGPRPLETVRTSVDCFKPEFGGILCNSSHRVLRQPFGGWPTEAPGRCWPELWPAAII